MQADYDKQQIENFKKKNEGTIKGYGDGLPKDSFLHVGDWVMSYCLEDVGISFQKTLAVSREDKEEFLLHDLTLDFHFIFDVFGKPRMTTINTFKNRGYTMMFVF